MSANSEEDMEVNTEQAQHERPLGPATRLDARLHGQEGLVASTPLMLCFLMIWAGVSVMEA